MCVCVLPWSGWHAFVPRSLTLSHFVHPCATVKAIPSAHETCSRVHLYVHVEPCGRLRRASKPCDGSIQHSTIKPYLIPQTVLWSCGTQQNGHRYQKMSSFEVEWGSRCSIYSKYKDVNTHSYLHLSCSYLSWVQHFALWRKSPAGGAGEPLEWHRTAAVPSYRHKDSKLCSKDCRRVTVLVPHESGEHTTSPGLQGSQSSVGYMRVTGQLRMSSPWGTLLA